MRDSLTKLTIVIGFIYTLGSAVIALGQGSSNVLPPVSINTPVAPVQVGNAPTSPSQSTSAPFWTKLNNAPPVSIGAMLLLTDGRILAHEEPNCNIGPTCAGFDFGAWYALTPDTNGSYVNGTWTQVASMPPGYAPLYFSTAVLRDGKVIAEGGEYDCPGAGQCAPEARPCCVTEK